ncbi:serine/threonine-protein kinase [Streptomyces sp. NPDC052043]|uniref:serine/threonine-protein kinase n=1 Tax=Streptomyces sp. NPDC052043 TaxID=3365684 RepID=UPI0037D04FCF
MDDLRDGDPRQIGPFRLQARLGSGGMGTVYLARRDGQGEYVAVKTIKGGHAQEEQFRRRFTREAAAASAVRCPYTVRVIGFDTSAPEPWLATEYVDGHSLRDHVQERGALGIASSLELGLGLTLGLTAIHQAGLVHRDLKPGNILLTPDGPKIIDFGLVYASDFSKATHTGMILGTPGYYSPEQVRGKAVAPESDIYSLGAVLAYASSGEHAFRGVNALTAQYHVVFGKPDLSAVPQELRDLISACMQKDPQRRPGLDEVQAYLTSLRDHGFSRTVSLFPWAQTKTEEPEPSSDSTINDSPNQRRTPIQRRKKVELAVSLVLAVGILAVGAYVLQHDEKGKKTSGGGGPTSNSSSPTSTPSTASASPSESVSDDSITNLIGSLRYVPHKNRCVMDPGGAPVDSADGYSVTVIPVQRHGEYLSKAIVRIQRNPAVLPNEKAIVHVTFPKGEDTHLAMPVSKTDWSFTWPDQVSSQLTRSIKDMRPVELFGAYTVVVVHGTVQACGGLNGDIKGYSS